MITIISKKHVRYQDDRDVVIAVIAVTTSSELPTRDGIDNLRLHEASRAWDITNGVVYGFTNDNIWHEQPSDGISAGAFTIKGRVDTYADLLRVQNPEPGWVYFVGLETDAEFKEYVYTDQNVWEFVGYNSITVDPALSTTSENPVQNKVVTNAINNKADAATTITGYGITDAKIESGTITLGSNTITPLTEHQDISGKADKATTLSGYGITDTYTKSEVDSSISNKVDKVSGKGLSTEDYTTSEKTKLSGIEEGANKTEVDNYLSTESENPVQNRIISAAIINAYTPKHYGFTIDQSNSDPFTNVTYTHDAVGLMAAHMDFTNEQFDYGSWLSENPWFLKDAYPVALRYDGIEDYRLDPNDYNKKLDGTSSDIEDDSYEGNFMMAIPRIWFKRSTSGGMNIIEISDAQLDSDYKAYAHTDRNGKLKDYIYLPLFKGSLISGRLRSLAGKQPESSTTTSQELSYAEANGIGWQIWDRSSRELICDILTLIGRSTDSQTTFGRGQESGGSSASDFVRTGTLRDKGLFYGYSGSTSEVKVLGIEGFWGTRWDRQLGLILLDNVWKVKMTPPYDLTGIGFITPNGATVPSYNDYLKTIHSSEFGSLPASILGTSSTYFCDYFYRTTAGTRVAVAGGGCVSGTGCGFRCVNVSFVAGYSNWYIGASLVYK